MADEIFFIDDKEKNVEAAKKEGMGGLIFHDINNLNKELQEVIYNNR